MEPVDACRLCVHAGVWAILRNCHNLKSGVPVHTSVECRCSSSGIVSIRRLSLLMKFSTVKLQMDFEGPWNLHCALDHVLAPSSARL
jgi:hypothetical protein